MATGTSGARLDTTARSGADGTLARILDFIERHRYAVLAVLTVVYFAGTGLRARSSPFWHDEIYTLLLSHLDLKNMWAALKEGIDSSPPMADILVRSVNTVWGEGPIVSRIPAMVGFWAFCLCLFAFTRRRLNIAYAFTALLIPFSTGAYTYAIQARCYGILLGFCGISLVAWQAAAEGRRRRLALPVLALSLLGALLCHFYTILLLLPYGGAELWRNARQRRIDWPMWIALGAGTAAGLTICYPLILATRVYRGHPWAIPHLRNLMEYYPAELQPLLSVAILFLVMGAVWLAMRGRDALDFEDTPRMPGHELVAAVLFVMIPVAGYVTATLVTKMFSDRYFISAIAGVSLLTVFCAAALSRGSRVVGTLMLLACAGPAGWLMAHHLPHLPVIDLDPLLHQALDQGPLVMDDGVRFLEQWYYLPAERKSQVSYVSDPESDFKWVGHDTVDVGMRMLHRWFGVPVVDYASVHQPGKTFRLYHNTSGPNWMLNRMLEDGASLELLANSGDRAVYQATIPAR